jgi:hypothetical protein
MIKTPSHLPFADGVRAMPQAIFDTVIASWSAQEQRLRERGLLSEAENQRALIASFNEARNAD